VEAYPRFVPWIKQARVLSRKDDIAGWRGDVEVAVGWDRIARRYVSNVTCAIDDLSVNIELVSGPLRFLQSRWVFEALRYGARVRFHAEFEFDNPILQQLAHHNRKLVSAQIINAFEKEASRQLKRVRSGS
jgi:ribosome-associated toxin RatA of RatAB toxin-antitoxin module